MTPELTVIAQLVILAVTAIMAVHAASSARRAASFDLVRDFDALAAAVGKLQAQARSAHMSKVRQAAQPPDALVETLGVKTAPGPLSHEQLREIARRKNGAHQ